MQNHEAADPHHDSSRLTDLFDVVSGGVDAMTAVKGGEVRLNTVQAWKKMLDQMVELMMANFQPEEARRLLTVFLTQLDRLIQDAEHSSFNRLFVGTNTSYSQELHVLGTLKELRGQVKVYLSMGALLDRIARLEAAAGLTNSD